MFTEKQIRYQITNQVDLWDRICEFLYGGSFCNILINKEFPTYSGLEHSGFLNGLNKIHSEINEFLLFIQDPKHLRIETIFINKHVVEVQIFYKDEFKYGNLYNKSDYLGYTYINLIDLYKHPKFSELYLYKKMMDRDKLINEILINDD